MQRGLETKLIHDTFIGNACGISVLRNVSFLRKTTQQSSKFFGSL